MKKFLVLLLVGILCWDNLPAQRVRFLAPDVNFPGFNNLYPAFSGDGSSLLYMYDYSNDGSLIVLYTYKDGIDWVKPVELDKFKPDKVNLPGGYCMNYDGTMILFTSRRGNGVGGFDIWMMTKGSNGWSNARNIGIPINSKGHEGFPSLSTDGSQLYFTRCDNMTNEEWSGCKIMVSNKKPGQRGGWEEPTELPPPVNMGNDAAPRILSDGVSLVFASDRPGGKGGIDLYFSQYENGEWTKPKNMDFVNSEGYDLSYSMNYRSDQAIFSALDRRDKFSLAYIRIPEEFQPKKVLGITGNADIFDPESNGNLIVRDFNTGELTNRIALRNQNTEYEVVLPNGNLFEFSVESQNSGLSFYSQLIDNRDLSNSRKIEADITLQPIEPGVTIPLQTLLFNQDNYEPDSRSSQEIARLERIIKNNTDLSFEFLIYQDSVISDTVQLPGLTEIRYDTVMQWVRNDTLMQVNTMETQELDSMLTEWNDSLANTYQDSLLVDTLLSELMVKDSVQVETAITIYTNDRTPKLAESLLSKFIESGINEENISATGMGDQEKPEGDWIEEQLANGFTIVRVRRKD